MNSQNVVFKWLAIIIGLTVLLSSVLLQSSASAQGETPTTGTPFPTLIPSTPTPTAANLPSPSSIQSTSESMTLLSAGWSTPVNISDTNYDSSSPSIAVDSNGVVHIVWAETENGGAREIYYKYKNEIGWSTPVNVSNSSAFESIDPQIAVDSAGRAHIVWGEQDDDYASDSEIYYSYCTGQTCTTPVSLSGPPDWYCGKYSLPQDWRSEIPILGINQADRILVEWRANEPVELTMPYSTWLSPGTPPTVRSGCVPAGAGVIDRAVGSSRLMGGTTGDFGLVFEELRSDGDPGVYYSFYSNGQWLSPSFLEPGRLPDVFLDPTSNEFNLTWCDLNSNIRYWNSATQTVETIPAAVCNWHSPVAKDMDGLIRVVWQETGQIYESRRLVEGWSGKVDISQSSTGASNPDMVADEYGRLHLVWQELHNGNLEIFYSTDSSYGCSEPTDIYEPDDTSATGSSIIIGEEQRHSLCPQSDEDWVNFDTSTNDYFNRNVLVETFDLEPDSIHPNGDTQVTVFDTTGINQIGTNQDRGFGPSPGSLEVIKSSRVVWHPATDGVFNINIFPETQINEQEGSGYSLRIANPLSMVDPVDQGSWSPTRVNVPYVSRFGSVIYFTQYFSYEQAELDELINLNTTLAWEFRRSDVVPSTGVEIKDSNIDFGDYWKFMNGVCVGEYWTNLPNPTDEYSEESNLILGCEDKDEPGNLDNEEFEIFIDDPSALIADKLYFVMIKFYVHNSYLNNDYQFYISKAEHCKKQSWPIPDEWCNVIQGQKSSANLIEGYLQPAP